MCANLLPRSYIIQGLVAFDATQTKKRSCRDRHPVDQFLLLAIELFGCLHKIKQANVFLHDCANVIFELERARKPSFLSLGYFSLSKNFNYVAEDANILHLKSRNGSRPSYFSISTPLRHTPHRHS